MKKHTRKMKDGNLENKFGRVGRKNLMRKLSPKHRKHPVGLCWLTYHNCFFSDGFP